MATPDPVTIIVPGNSRPEAKHQVSRGKWTRRIDKPQSQDFKAKCAVFAVQAMAGHPLFDEPLEVWFIWRKPRPSGYRKHECEWHKKPDVNNLMKIAEDALTGIVWRDDSLLCTVHLRKEFAEVEELEVRVQVLHADWPYREADGDAAPPRLARRVRVLPGGPRKEAWRKVAAESARKEIRAMRPESTAGLPAHVQEAIERGKH